MTDRKASRGGRGPVARGDGKEGRQMATSGLETAAGRRTRKGPASGAKGSDREPTLFEATKPAARRPAPAPEDAAREPEPASQPVVVARAGRGGGNGNGRRPAETAQSMAARQREISVSEFFTKNRHLLGFDNPQKALLTTVKEAVDNSLDACEEAAILPEIVVEIREVGDGRYRVAVEDNGPGIVKAQVPNIFGKLLYGSKFHALKQARGQQGIGISAAGMFGSLTTGKPVAITSRISARQPAHYYELHLDTRKNQPSIVKDAVVEFARPSGTRVEIELEAVYKKGRRSVDDFVEQTALANPHATFVYRPPGGEETRYERVTAVLPREATAILPHPYGVELGALLKMMRETRARNLVGALTSDFSRVSTKVAEAILQAAALRPEASPKRLSQAEVERLFKAIPTVKIMAPPSSCLSPIGEDELLAGLRERVKADFYAAVTRSPEVYRGMPFQVEVALAYGGELPGDELIDLRRFANRVPLIYQQAACALTKAVLTTAWRSYNLEQARGALPTGPVVLFLHIASAWVPFTSESKEAIAHYPEIVKEARLGLQEVGRKLGLWLRARKRAEVEGGKRDYIKKYIPHLVQGLQQILGFNDQVRDETVEELRSYLVRTRKGVSLD
jgi:DNA topoisomerase-6 subunit B